MKKRIVIAIVGLVLLFAFAFTAGAVARIHIEKTTANSIEHIHFRPFDITDDGQIVHVDFVDGSSVEFRALYGWFWTKDQVVSYMLYNWDGTTA